MENSVQLLGWYGGDTTHAMSAWTSTERDLEGKRDRIPSLLAMLEDNEHGTPFEKSFLHFLVTADTATHIHIIKHRIGVSVNGESARYKELKDDKFLVPHDWPEEDQQDIKEWMWHAYHKYHTKVEKLTPMLGRKRAKESARFLLPYANQIDLDVSFNWRSFVLFQELRNSEHAQLEVREVAKKMLNLVRGIEGNPFKHTLEAFGYGT